MAVKQSTIDKALFYFNEMNRAETRMREIQKEIDRYRNHREIVPLNLFADLQEQHAAHEHASREWERTTQRIIEQQKEG